MAFYTGSSPYASTQIVDDQYLDIMTIRPVPARPDDVLYTVEPQYNHRPDFILLTDIYAKPWIRDYTLAIAKFTLGEARSKFSTIAGPQGGGQLNGDALKAEAQNEMQILDQQIGNYQEGGTPLSFTIG